VFYRRTRDDQALCTDIAERNLRQVCISAEMRFNETDISNARASRRETCPTSGNPLINIHERPTNQSPE